MRTLKEGGNPLQVFMKELLTSPKFIAITLAIIALIITPLTLIQLQNRQNIKQNAETIYWTTNQSASTSCATDGGGAVISVTFTNTEQRSSSTDMNVIAKDQQTGKSVNMGSIQGGDTKTDAIDTGRTSLNASSVTFKLSWTDGHSGTDSRTADYGEVNNCTPIPTSTPQPPTPTTPPGSPTPTICPTLEPVKNVHIVCPNCQLSPSPSQASPSLNPSPSQ